MKHIAIDVRDIDKVYKIGSKKQVDSLVSSIAQSIISPLQRLRLIMSGKVDTAAGLDKDFWALRDISFKVEHGEVLGIIGHNGAGKSTLLKILSRITKPTKGEIHIKGRVGSLLEIGTGFHPDLTGRENIFLNGSILGMTRVEIQAKFDEIVEFAGIEEFIDTPIKHYSSGMGVRLGFAVAAHLEPDILIVDEVLAVGDAEFQRKCLQKMGSVSREGRTVLFVSHNMSAIENLCTRAILLEKGQIKYVGETSDVVSTYLSRYYNNDRTFADLEREGNGKLRVLDMHLEDSDGNIISALSAGEDAIFCFHYETNGLRATDKISFGIGITSSREQALANLYSDFSDTYLTDLPKRGIVRLKIPNLPFTNGDYLMSARVVMNGPSDTGIVLDFPQGSIPFQIRASDYYGTGNLQLPRWGHTLVRGQWDVISTHQN